MLKTSFLTSSIDASIVTSGLPDAVYVDLSTGVAHPTKKATVSIDINIFIMFIKKL